MISGVISPCKKQKHTRGFELIAWLLRVGHSMMLANSSSASGTGMPKGWPNSSIIWGASGSIPRRPAVQWPIPFSKWHTWKDMSRNRQCLGFLLHFFGYACDDDFPNDWNILTWCFCIPKELGHVRDDSSSKCSGCNLSNMQLSWDGTAQIITQPDKGTLRMRHRQTWFQCFEIKFGRCRFKKGDLALLVNGIVHPLSWSESTESLMTFLQMMPYESYGVHERFSDRFVTPSHPLCERLESRKREMVQGGLGWTSRGSFLRWICPENSLEVGDILRVTLKWYPEGVIFVMKWWMECWEKTVWIQQCC